MFTHLQSKPLSAPRVALITISEDINFTAVAQQLVAVAKNQNLVGLILIINSNGGHLGSFSVIYDLIKEVGAAKPVIGLIGQGALSCGYLLASATNFIFVHSLSEVGCIGVLRQINRYKNSKAKENNLEAEMQVEFFHAGEFKNITPVYAKDLTEDQKKFVQADLDASYQLFLDLVAKNRKLNREAYREWAEGRIFYPDQAIERGLVDAKGTIFDAEKKVRELVVEKNPHAHYGPGVELVRMQ